MKKIFVLIMLFFICFSPAIVQAALVDAGDINFDGQVNILDAVLLKQHILGIKLLNEEELLRADMNLDGKVDIIDLVYIVKIRILEISDPEA